MLQQDQPEDYVVATGETHEVREFVELAFAAAGIEDWDRYVKQDERFMRPAEVDLLVGDLALLPGLRDGREDLDLAAVPSLERMADRDSHARVPAHPPGWQGTGRHAD